MDIDEAIDGLLEAVTSAGLSAASPPTDPSPLEELEAVLAPLAVPRPVRRFWQRVDPSTLRVSTYPCLHGPDFARQCWLMARDEFAAFQPTALLQIAYSSHQCMSVELDQPEIPGGALFEWNVVDGGFERRFNDLQGWLTYVTKLITTDRCLLQGPPNDRQLLVPSPEDWQVEPGWRPRPAPHPIYGTVAIIGRDILAWPQHWQRLAGLTPQSIQPRGATHTIAELAETDPAQQVQATIVAKVVSLVGVGAETTVRVDDGTGFLVVHCPVGTTLLGPVLRDWFEFDVVVPAGPRRTPLDPDSVANDEPDPERRLEARFLAQYGQPAGALATAIRRATQPTDTS